jgi:hypothetical protein
MLLIGITNDIMKYVNLCWSCRQRKVSQEPEAPAISLLHQAILLTHIHACELPKACRDRQHDQTCQQQQKDGGGGDPTWLLKLKNGVM